VEHADAKASSIAGEVLGSIRMIVACGAEGRIAKKYAGWIQESLRRGLRLSPMIGLQFAPCKFAVFPLSLSQPLEETIVPSTANL
jgi:ATP-binding cassette subfamily B (MDR/TAP) protein 1